MPVPYTGGAAKIMRPPVLGTAGSAGGGTAAGTCGGWMRRADEATLAPAAALAAALAAAPAAAACARAAATAPAAVPLAAPVVVLIVLVRLRTLPVPPPRMLLLAMLLRPDGGGRCWAWEARTGPPATAVAGFATTLRDALALVGLRAAAGGGTDACAAGARAEDATEAGATGPRLVLRRDVVACVVVLALADVLVVNTAPGAPRTAEDAVAGRATAPTDGRPVDVDCRLPVAVSGRAPPAVAATCAVDGLPDGTATAGAVAGAVVAVRARAAPLLLVARVAGVLAARSTSPWRRC